MGIYQENGRRLKVLLVEKGVTQKEFAKSIGVCTQTVSAWVNGYMIPYKNRKEIAEYFGVDIGFVMGTQNERVRKHPAVERQVIATWYTPQEKLPPADWDTMLLTVSGKGEHITFDHVLKMGGFDPATGWYLDDIDSSCLKDFVVHAWCDIDPYKG